jgi:hypothetical protein
MRFFRGERPDRLAVEVTAAQQLGGDPFNLGSEVLLGDDRRHLFACFPEQPFGAVRPGESKP